MVVAGRDCNNEQQHEEYHLEVDRYHHGITLKCALTLFSRIYLVVIDLGIDLYHQFLLIVL